LISYHFKASLYKIAGTVFDKS